MHNSSLWFLILIPGLPLLAALLSLGGSAVSAGRLATLTAGAALAVAVLGTCLLIVSGAAQWHWSVAGEDSPLALTFRLDAVSMTMALLVSFVGLAVIRFSKNYLAGDPHQRKFFGWLLATLASVLTLVISGNLLVLWVAWVATSLCLHQLLVFYPDRSAALFAARKKFVFSRLGDVCLLVALGVIYAHFGTFELDRLFAAAAEGQRGGLALVGWLLVGCAMLKSAQFPFHGWLPDTMETPTPVSALMHAGIINAGGFLLIRLSPLLVGAAPSLHFLAGVGAITAAFGAVVMLVQPSVKRALAFSTIAQMGFMLLQCGLGAFGLALLHIVAHSLYKAHAFLRSGSNIGAVPRAAVPLRTGQLALGVLVGVVATLAAMAVAKQLLPYPAPFVLVIVTALALAYGMARFCANSPGVVRVILACVASFVASGLVFGLHGVAAFFYAELPISIPPLWVSVFVGAVFVGLFFIQSYVWRAGRTAFGRQFYVHALNGFYVGTWGNRLLDMLWPPHRVDRIVQRPVELTPAIASDSYEKAI